MKCNELEENIIKIICVTGISRLKELKKLESLSSFSPNEINAAIKRLAESNIVTRENVYSGGSARHNFSVFELSHTGKEIAESLTNEKPSIPQKEVKNTFLFCIKLCFLIYLYFLFYMENSCYNDFKIKGKKKGRI